MISYISSSDFKFLFAEKDSNHSIMRLVDGDTFEGKNTSTIAVDASLSLKTKVS